MLKGGGGEEGGGEEGGVRLRNGRPQKNSKLLNELFLSAINQVEVRSRGWEERGGG